MDESGTRNKLPKINQTQSTQHIGLKIRDISAIAHD